MNDEKVEIVRNQLNSKVIAAFGSLANKDYHNALKQFRLLRALWTNFMEEEKKLKDTDAKQALIKHSQIQLNRMR